MEPTAPPRPTAPSRPITPTDDRSVLATAAVAFGTTALLLASSLAALTVADGTGAPFAVFLVVTPVTAVALATGAVLVGRLLARLASVARRRVRSARVGRTDPTR